MDRTITLIATDLDGTFLNSKKEVSRTNREMIHRLKEKGILFGICSGRPIDTVRPLIQQWGIEKSVSFIVGMNGGALYDLQRKEKEEYHLISGQDAIAVMDFFDDLPVEFYVVIGTVKFVNHSTEESRAEAMSYGAFEVETDLREFLQARDINKLILWFDEKDRDRIEQRAKMFYRDNLVGINTGPGYYEYQDPRVNKGFGIKKLAKHYGTTLEHILVFGDAPNDLEMLEKAGVGVCMKNGSEECKKIADITTERTNDQSGVGHFIQTHILND
ncbi:MAG: HAD family phosphatase [Erysipelotrichaceae bacterium]|nr:HAD family phosphatase [Erysipelotrichaceae bacterium]